MESIVEQIPKPLTDKSPSQILLTTKLIQGSGKFKEVESDGTFKHCAIGALLEELWDGSSFKDNGAGGVNRGYLDYLVQLHPKFDTDTLRICPVEGCGYKQDALWMIPHLNNSPDDWDHSQHGWTFEQIGQWLASIGL